MQKFSDIGLENKYNEKGYLFISGFLNLDELETLKKVYITKEKSFFDKGFHRTLDLKNLKKKTDICNLISRTVTPVAQKYLKDYRCLLNSFMTKEKSAEAFDVHQNWTFVDEDKYTSLVIWIPLQDVDEYNGTLYFVPGSDKWEKHIRGNNIPWYLENRKEELLKQMIPISMKAGDAVIFDDATVHYTSANNSTLPRVSIAQVMIPKAARPVFYNKDLKTGEIEKCEITDSFYLSFMDKYIKGDYSEIINRSLIL